MYKQAQVGLLRVDPLISTTFVFLIDIRVRFKQKVSNLPFCRWNVQHLHRQKAHIKHLHLSSVVHKKEQVRSINTPEYN